MGVLFLVAASAYLFGNLLVGFLPQLILSAGLLLCAGMLVIGVVSTWRLAFVGIMALALGWLGYAHASHELAGWQALDATMVYTGKVQVVKREVAKTWYQPVTLEPIIPKLAQESRILWRAPRTFETKPGDQLVLTCSLSRPENFDPRFDYRTYLAAHGVGYVCERAGESEELPRAPSWRRALFTIQQALEGQIVKALPEPAAGLLQGLFLGGSDTLPQALNDQFRRAGLSHIVAVSGYNMTLVAFAVLFLALLSGLWRRTATLLAMLGIFVFLLLIDSSAASLRAALMVWIVFLAFFLDRPTHAVNGLVLAGLLMTVENPLIVRYDVGFQLSFLATLALIVASPWLERLVRGQAWWQRLVLIPLSTLAIESFILPVMAFHFGTVNLLGPLANTLVLPLIPLVMLLGFLTLLIGSVIPVLAPVVAFPTWLILMSIIWVAEHIGALPWSTSTGWYPSIWLLSGWYVVLSGVLWYSRKLHYAYALRMDQSSRSH